MTLLVKFYNYLVSDCLENRVSQRCYLKQIMGYTNNVEATDESPTN